MSADFCYQIVPLCKLTENRWRELCYMIDEVTEEDEDFFIADYWSCRFEDGAELSDIKRELKAIISEDYKSFHKRRDTGGLFLKDITYLLTGGMSWGDDPTDSYAEFEVIESTPKIWKKLEEWSREDSEKGIKVY